MAGMFLSNRQCWMKHLSLDFSSGLDPEGIRVRNAQGLDAVDFFFPGASSIHQTQWPPHACGAAVPALPDHPGATRPPAAPGVRRTVVHEPQLQRVPCPCGPVDGRPACLWLGASPMIVATGAPCMCTHLLPPRPAGNATVCLLSVVSAPLMNDQGAWAHTMLELLLHSTFNRRIMTAVSSPTSKRTPRCAGVHGASLGEGALEMSRWHCPGVSHISAC